MNKYIILVAIILIGLISVQYLTNTDTQHKESNFKEFESEWYSIISQTKYERYDGHNKSINQSLSEKRFNCYDGAYVTAYLAYKHDLQYEIIQGEWEGVRHGAVRVYKDNGSEIFDTKQLQQGYGQNGCKEIKWVRVDYIQTMKSKIENMIGVKI